MKTKLNHCQTLRTSAATDSLICDAAYEARLSKAAWIRLAIERSLQLRRQRQEPVLR